MSIKRRPIDKKVRQEIYERQDYKCAFCGRRMKRGGLTIDHIRPLARNGKNDVNNYLPACLECNRFKAAMTKNDFRLMIRRAIEKTNAGEELSPREARIYRWFALEHYKKPKDFKFFFERQGRKRDSINRAAVKMWEDKE